jgi:iron-sulfur cluster repair protein YtfE (RIC family)
MSEETTEDIAQKYNTKPTIETVLERINAFDAQFNARLDKMEENLSIRLDRIESVAHETQSKFHGLRADFNEFKKELREHFPSAVK